MTAKSIVVCGGNGFLGSRICRVAVQRGMAVTSISRSGAPSWAHVSSSPHAPDWAENVEWQKADILKPTTYQAYLTNKDAVVHSMGILLEADYKGVISGKESPIDGLRRAFSSTKHGSTQNPLDRNSSMQAGEADGQLTYELMNRDSGKLSSCLLPAVSYKVAISLANEASAAGISTFVYISAAAGAPILPKRYISTKREAESVIGSSFPQMRSTFIRPGFLYDSSRTFTLPIAFAGTVGSMINSALGGTLTQYVGSAVEKPLKADLVAEAVVEAIENGETHGVANTGIIESLAERAWRRSML